MRWLILWITVCPCIAQAQKPVLDIPSLQTWKTPHGAALSSDGKYMLYVMTGDMTVQSTGSDWKHRISGVSEAKFFGDGFIAAKTGNDSVVVIRAGESTPRFREKTAAFKLAETSGHIAYMQGSTLYIRNAASGKLFSITGATGYDFSPDGNALLAKQDSSSLVLLDLRRGAAREVWRSRGDKLLAYVFDQQGEQYAFLSEQSKTQRSLWYGNMQMTEARQLIADAQDSTLVIGTDAPAFSPLGGKIFFTLEPRVKPVQQENAVQVDVWSYMDPQIQSRQLEELRRKTSYAAVIGPNGSGFCRIEQPREEMTDKNDRYALLGTSNGMMSRYEAYWNRSAQVTYTLLSLNDGARKIVRRSISNMQERVMMSPSGKWVLYYDADAGDYFAYNIAAGTARNLTSSLHVDWTDELDDHPERNMAGYAQWLDHGDAVIIGDTYDLWLLDLSAQHTPVNITNGYGRKHQIRFEAIGEAEALLACSARNRSKLLLKTMNRRTKDWGFSQATLGRQGDPVILCSGPYVYGHWNGFDSYNYPPVKARSADMYLVTRSSAAEMQNYFVTKDFRSFRAMTDVHPQRAYNWYTTELHEWRSPDGRLLQGILYKPENFDSTKRYPLIFDYYERRSDELNMFIYPHASEDRINIPLFVSQGYLVFTPDIHYSVGDAGNSAYNSVVSAAKYLSRMPFVDASRMGLQGHSFGGFETNYIVAHTGMFRAACSAAGIADQVSKYGSGTRGGFTMYLLEKSQTRMGANLWERPDLYIRNSPVFLADKVTTPLLLMHNKNDGAVAFTQGLEFFTTLRRLGKRVWMLQYDEGRHGVGGKDAVDFHNRMLQFFDHYLKDRPAPSWMLNGIPAAMKGVESGFELIEEKDSDGKWRTPPVGGLLGKPAI